MRRSRTSGLDRGAYWRLERWGGRCGILRKRFRARQGPGGPSTQPIAPCLLQMRVAPLEENTRQDAPGDSYERGEQGRRTSAWLRDARQPALSVSAGWSSQVVLAGLITRRPSVQIRPLPPTGVRQSPPDTFREVPCGRPSGRPPVVPGPNTSMFASRSPVLVDAAPPYVRGDGVPGRDEAAPKGWVSLRGRTRPTRPGSADLRRGTRAPWGPSPCGSPQRPGGRRRSGSVPGCCRPAGSG